MCPGRESDPTLDLFGPGPEPRLDPNCCQAFVENLQALADFEEGELICAWSGAFRAVGKGCTMQTSTASWKLMDAKQGVVDSGSVTVEMVQRVSSLPSACCRAEALINGKEGK